MNPKNTLLILLLILSANQVQAGSQEIKRTKTTTTTTTKVTNDGDEKTQRTVTSYVKDDGYVFPNSHNIEKLNAQLPEFKKLILPEGAKNPPVPVSLSPSPGYTIRYNPTKDSFEEVKQYKIKRVETTETTREERK